MINTYRGYLEGKSTSNFWKKAKQKEYTSDVVSKILKEVTVDFNKLTTRNSITLRYLGLIINLGGDKLKISNAGETFIKFPYKQKILDEQIMKVYLDCPQLNSNLSIKVAPMEILLNILYSVNYITFEEYQLFICWVNDKAEIPIAIQLVEEFRKSENPDRYKDILKEKSHELGIEDFSDNVRRFYDMLLISSYIKKTASDKIETNLSKRDIEIILESFSLRNFSDEGYFDYLTENDGWRVYNIDPGYLKVIDSLEKKTTEEKEEIINQITGGLKFPDISKVTSRIINIEIEPSSDIELRKKRKTSAPSKINFELRDGNNRAVGDFAEKIVIKHEKDELNNVHSSLVNEVKQLSLIDDTLGYDILSYNTSGAEKHIEVKAVRNKPGFTFRFYISDNEVAIAKIDPNYHLYIVFDYLSENPYIYKMPNPFLGSIPGVIVDPIKYLVTVRIKK